MRQITNHLLMIRPADFRINEETAVNNYFQRTLEKSPDEITHLAQKEFDNFVDKLRAAKVKVKVIDDIQSNNTPDSIFPNNWISFHADRSEEHTSELQSRPHLVCRLLL